MKRTAQELRAADRDPVGPLPVMRSVMLFSVGNSLSTPISNYFLLARNGILKQKTFEIGYAHAVNKPVIFISRENCSEANAMLIGSAKVVVKNVFDDEQINRLAGLILFYFCTWKA